MPTLTHPLTLTQLLSQLVSHVTVSSDLTANQQVLDWIEAQLTGLPLRIQRLSNDGVPALIATTPTADPINPRLWLAGHIDVVPAASADFKLQQSGNRLVGRGAFDMKYAIACYLRLLQALGPELAHYDLGLLLTADEESGGTRGARWLVEDVGLRGKAVLMPECGTSWTIEIGAKGTMSWRLHATGLAGHASRPWNSVNAIDQLIAFVDNLKANVPSEPCGDPEHHHSTVSLGHINGGSVHNQIPGEATGLLDIRLAPGTTIDDVQGWIEAAMAAVPGVQAHMEHGSGPTVNPLEGPAAIFAAAASEVAGIELTPTLSHGASDGRYFSAHNIPVISVPPTGGGQHSSHEWIELSSLDQYYEITRRFVERWARS